KKLSLLILIASLFSLELLAQRGGDIVPGELLVQLRPGKQVSTLANSVESAGITVKELLSDIMQIYLLEVDESKIQLSSALDLVKYHPSVHVAQYNHYIDRRDDKDYELKNPIENSLEPNFQNSEIFPNDPSFNQQWALHNTGQSGGTVDADIDAPEAWVFSTGGLTALGDTIVIAVVDGGVDLTHPDLNLWRNWGEIPGNNIDDDGNGYIDDIYGWNAYNNNGTIPSDNHGTHVSGITAARGNNNLGVSGVNWNAKVMILAGSSSNEATVVRAYSYILKQRTLYNQTNGVQGAFVVVTNASFGVDYGNPANYPIWCGIYDSLGVAGILSCGATANLNINIDVTGDIPTACPSDFMVSVTNTTRTDTRNSGAAYGLTTIDLGAPGTQIYNTTSGGSYGNLTGTSMATPTVAGGIALMFAAANQQFISAYKLNPAAGALQIKQFLMEGTDPISALAGVTVSGGRLNVYNSVLSVAATPDTVPPTQITDLAVVDPTSNRLRISWTTPSDTSRNGVQAYIIRRSNSPILNDNDFNNAVNVPFTGSSLPAGTPASQEVSGLEPGTTYYFAIKSSDIWGNISLLSNSATGSTLAPPVLSVNPRNIYHLVMPNQSIVDSFVVSNISTTNSTLDYSISLINNTFPQGILNFTVNQNPSKVRNTENITNLRLLPEITGSSLRGSGGPDAFGYKWIDSREPNGPAYVWDDIVSTGTLLSTWVQVGTYDPKDEGYAGPINFNFKLYGVQKTQVYISANGYLTTAPLTSSSFTNANIPAVAAPNDLIAGFWDDLDGTSGGTVHYKIDGSKLIVQFTNWPRFSTAGSSYTFQYVVSASGQITVYYKTMTGTLNSATIGIENSTGTIGLPVAYNANFVENNLALKISAEPDWVAPNHVSGTLGQNGSASLVMSMNSNDLEYGSYSMDVLLSSNDPAKPVDTLKVSMLVASEVPVELMSFNAISKNGSVELNWLTATETNNEGFEILRKAEGESNWSTLGFIRGQGTTTEPVSYSYIDNILKPGVYYYRLKQKDFDGTISFSQEIEADVTAPVEFALEQNYPNPFNPSTTIRFALPVDSKVSLIVYNHIGEQVAQLINSDLKAGFHETTFNAAGLSSGIYFYKLNAGSNSATKKLILLK
ncbi:MAG: S8 family serine peptidase, partial [Ignavibacteriaceae bacterium]|nr:S8 family serine peptidase [Ignavibacteriaceae bacterium]